MSFCSNRLLNTPEWISNNQPPGDFLILVAVATQSPLQVRWDAPFLKCVQRLSVRRVEYFPAECHRVMGEKKKPMLASVWLGAEMIRLHFQRMRPCHCEGRTLLRSPVQSCIGRKVWETWIILDQIIPGVEWMNVNRLGRTVAFRSESSLGLGEVLLMFPQQ